MIYQKLVPIYLYMRGLIMKFIFGRITMINFKQTYYPVNFYLPFLFTFFLAMCLKLSHKNNFFFHLKNFTDDSLF